jgi:hypothetical protein
LAVVRFDNGGLVNLEKPVLATSVWSRRTRSIARFRAVVTNHARGLSGNPSVGQRSAAMANAS